MYLKLKLGYEEWHLLGSYAVWFLQEPHVVSIPEDAILHSHRREHLKSSKLGYHKDFHPHHLPSITHQSSYNYQTLLS
jgi:hypothetical protein